MSAELTPHPPLQEERTLRLLKEASWIVLVFCAVYLALVLWGYQRADSVWSHATSQTSFTNPGGKTGAYLSDALFYLFGYSAWWWTIFLAFISFSGLRQLRNPDRRPLYIALAGFFLTLWSSCALETLHFFQKAPELPYVSGGILGLISARGLFSFFGFVGGTLIVLLVFGIGLSLFFGFSWFTASERLGERCERGIDSLVNAWKAWQDRRIGRVVTQQREAIVHDVIIKEQLHEPLHIEAPPPPAPPSPQLEKEKQKHLFPSALSPSPSLDLLTEAPKLEPTQSAEVLEFTSRQIELKLADFGIEANVLSAYPGPVVTRYEIQPAVGVKGSQIINLTKDLARALSVASVRMVETIPGKSCMGIELPNNKRQSVSLSQILGSKVFYDNKSPLPLGLGKDISGQPVVVDLIRMPHLLVAGTTGSGKSVGINAMILSILYKSPIQDVRLILVDPKMLELGVYNGIGHLLSPVVTDMKEAAQALQWCVREMDRRYRILSALGVRNLASYNTRIDEASKNGETIANPIAESTPLVRMPYIVVVIDELADLMIVAGKQVEEYIARLAQKARAAGIHLILATQRPSVDVITGLIKANIPTRISFQVSSKIDSRTILDQMGAESLLGQGDMLYLEPGGQTPVRVHGAFVSDEEVHRVVGYLKDHGPAPVYEQFKEVVDPTAGAPDGEDGGGDNDPLYNQALDIVRQSRRASISLVQRHLRIGYNRSARLLERMEREGVVSSMANGGNREVLIPAPTTENT